MPKTTPNPQSQKPVETVERAAPQFVRCELSKAQREELKLWADGQNVQDLMKWVNAKVVGGHVVSVRSNELGYQCSCTGSREVSGHMGLSLVARASSPVRALMSCWYRDTVILEGKWETASKFDELDF